MKTQEFTEKEVISQSFKDERCKWLLTGCEPKFYRRYVKVR